MLNCLIPLRINAANPLPVSFCTIKITKFFDVIDSGLNEVNPLAGIQKSFSMTDSINAAICFASIFNLR